MLHLANDATPCATDVLHPITCITYLSVSDKYLKRAFNEELLNEFKTNGAFRSYSR